MYVSDGVELELRSLVTVETEFTLKRLASVYLIAGYLVSELANEKEVGSK